MLNLLLHTQYNVNVAMFKSKLLELASRSNRLLKTLL